ncbi:MAG: right-handed parallel beta-helix repeat-containing protein [Candidatus Cloacimonetes bacterium]|nr:right-handed parallel beta-helix repeat-containing protein [Candidatus Cloacimonadota bacterium]
MKKALFFLILCTLFGGTLLADTPISGDIGDGQIWNLAGSPYILSGDVRLGFWRTLSIEAGVQVKFNQGASLTLGSYGGGGQIIAEGTNGAPIIFTANSTDPSPGFWNRIYFTNWNSDSVFEHCVFEYGGSTQGMITLDGGSPHFNNCVFTNSANYAIFDQNQNAKNLYISNCEFSDNLKTMSLYVDNVSCLGSGNIYTNNSDDRIHCPGGPVQRTSTWTAQTTPILFLADLNGGSQSPILTMPNGSILEFVQGARIFLNGGLVIKATGTTFRGEQSNRGHWKGFYFNWDAGNSILSGCLIRDAGYDNSPALNFTNPTSTVTGCTITSCSGTGIFTTYNCEQNISANIINGCGSYPLSILAEYVRLLGEANDFSGNDVDMVEVRSSTVVSSGVWRNPGVPYYFGSNVDIAYSSPFPHIKIMPGTVVKLGQGASIIIGSVYGHAQGSLEAEGVTFTRVSESALPGGLLFNHYVVDSQCLFTNCVFEYLNYSGYDAAILVKGNGPSFNNCIFRNNPGSAIREDAGGRFKVTNSSFENNGAYPMTLYSTNFDAVEGTGCSYSGNNPNRIRLTGGTLSEAKTYVWSNPGVALEITGDIKVAGAGGSTAILKLNSGLVLLFSPNTRLTIGDHYGSPAGIQADGASFSSLSGAANGWNGLELMPSSVQGSYLRNCLLEYAGGNGNIYLYRSQASYIDGCVIRYGAKGIFMTDGTSTPISKCYIYGNELGIYCNGNANPVIGGPEVGDGNSIYGNTSFGVINDSGLIIDARNNWWGFSSGPYHSTNPNGEGNAVSNNILFDPWRSSDIGDAPAGFNLISPANGSIVQTLTPLLDWEEAIDPTPGDLVVYTLEMALNASFNQGLHTWNGLNQSFFQVPAYVLSDDTRYFWRVKATDLDDQTTSCLQSHFWFDVAVPEAPLPFGLISPANNETVLLTSNKLLWQPSFDPDPEDYVSYTVYWDLSAGFENPGSRTTSACYAWTDFCAPGNLYYWRVKAFDSTGLETFSPIGRFWVHPDAKPRPPVDFTLTPLGFDLLVSWDEVPGADYYDLYYSPEPYSGFNLLQANLDQTWFLHPGGAMDKHGFYYVTAHDVR